MQRAGDIMYVPSMWAHMVVNTRPSIGAALEFDTGYWLYWVGEATLVPGGRITSHRSKNAQTKKKLPPCSTAARRRTAQETRGELEEEMKKENGSERVQIVACWSPRSAAAGDRVGASIFPQDGALR